MKNAVVSIPVPKNETVLQYGPGSAERAAIQGALKELSSQHRDMPLIIGGQEVATSKQTSVVQPHAHQSVLGTLHHGDASHLEAAATAAGKARGSWASMSYEERAAIFLKAADLLSGKYRAKINAATMLGQSKTVYQAEIDSACELADFWRFNVHFGYRILQEQPISAPGMWNTTDYRPLDGFVLAITPFNFTAIGGNLPTAPALMGNTVVWKPATTAALSAYVVMDILREAGLPDGVINLVSAEGRVVGETLLKHRDLGGVHFTGSTGTFNHIWATVSQQLGSYRCYPRLVGETGGKDFIVAHPSADVRALAVAIVRGGFEYQGQKCSAASRVYVPKSMWPALAPILEEEVSRLKVGHVADLSNFMGAVIDAKSFSNIQGYIDFAKQSSDAKVWLGGTCDQKDGYFIAPTIVLADNPKHKLMSEEIFGPVVTIYRYDESDFEGLLTLVDETSPYALTGAIFAQDRAAVAHMSERLRFAAGNFYINDKPTGAVVGQQPFGGGRASGTNDKAGSMLNLLRWVSPRTIKETFEPSHVVGYPYLLP